MKRFSTIAAMALLCLALIPQAAQAWHAEGRVLCDANGTRVVDAGDLPLAGIQVTVQGVGFAYTETTTTDADGKFVISLADFNATYTMTIGNNGVPIVYPAQVPAQF